MNKKEITTKEDLIIVISLLEDARPQDIDTKRKSSEYAHLTLCLYAAFVLADIV